MRFDRYARDVGITFTQRKQAAFERKLQREQQALPLFAEQVAAQQLGWDEERLRREANNQRALQSARNLQAKHWRRGRQAYYAMDEQTRAACREAWNKWTGPCGPTYFIYVVEGFSGAREARYAAIRERDRQLREEILRQMNAEMRQAPLLCA